MDIKSYFPILKKGIHYLDSAASTQKPIQVINKIKEVYSTYYANVHRGNYSFAEKSTYEYENARKIIASYFNADEKEIVFTKNATESLNLIAYSLRDYIKKNDVVSVFVSEHNSNFVPWQSICKEKKAKLNIVYLDKESFEPMDLEKQIEKSKIIAFAHISNVSGKIQDVKKICNLAKKNNCITVVDAAQSAGHLSIDVKKIGCDFLVATAHKMLSANLGITYIKKGMEKIMKPFLYGGEMIKKVSIKKTEFAEMPYRYEAGTPLIAEAIATKEAIKFLEKHKADKKKLLKNAIDILERNDADIIGNYPLKERGSLISFNIRGIHPHDLSYLLSEKNVMIRAGLHCADILHSYLSLKGSARLSFHIYNDEEDLTAFEEALKKAKRVLL